MKLRASMGVAAACAMVFLTANAFAQEKEVEEKAKEVLKDQAEEMKQQGQEMDPEMKAWMEAAMPGPNHKLLDYSVGTWDALVRSWMGPESEESKGVSVNEWVLGGRYVQTKYAGEAMGKPFNGIGYAGYDNVKKVFTSCWMDTMGAGMMIDEGSYDAASKTFTYTSKAPSPTGGTIESKTVVRIVSNDQHIMTMYSKAPGTDKMARMLEITYNRADKSAQPE